MNRHLRRLVLVYSCRSRERKAASIVRLIERTGARSVLLVGGLAGGAEPNEGIVERIVAGAVGQVVSINIFDPGRQPWPYLVADGCAMPFTDGSFDLVVSNAVIEHVGDAERQRAFVAEHRRIGKAWVITTPNRWFPVESHTSTAFAHWRAAWRAGRSEFTRLLSRRDFRALMPPEARVTGRQWSATFSAAGGHLSSAAGRDQVLMRSADR